MPSGCSCLVQRFGEDLGEFSPGLHIVPSYYRIAYVVTKQACTYDAPVLMCPTADDVRVSVDVVLVFNINDPQKFIFGLGATNFDEYLSGTVDEAIRMLVRKETHQTVYTLRGDRADLMLRLLNEKFQESGVHFSDVKIIAVWLPDELANCLEQTTQMEKAMEKLRRQTEFEVLEIKQESEMQVEEIKRKAEQVLVTENGRKRRAELQFQQKKVRADEEAGVATLEAEEKGEVALKRSQAKLNRTKTSLETARVDETSRTEAAANARRIRADTIAEEKEIEAQWMEEQMVCDAEATKFEADAEKEASKSLVAKRQHELELREKRILGKLAAGGHFKLIGTPGDQLVSAMMTGHLGTAKEDVR